MRTGFTTHYALRLTLPLALAAVGVLAVHPAWWPGMVAAAFAAGALLMPASLPGGQIGRAHV